MRTPEDDHENPDIFQLETRKKIFLEASFF